MEYEYELYHYGVPGMRWGIRRARKKAAANEKLILKSHKYDAKAASLHKKSEKLHAKKDLERASTKNVKADKYAKKAANLNKRATKSDDDSTRISLERKAAKASYKAAKYRVDGNRIAKTTGYGIEAMKYSLKSDQIAKKAEKTRLKIANNKSYISMMERKASSLSQEELNSGYAFVNEWLKER